MTRDPIFVLCDQVREIGFAIHEYLRHGHLESVYEKAMTHRLQKAGIRVQQQTPLEVRDEDGTLLGTFKADLLVGDVLIIELKACDDLCDAHTAQLLGYLRASGLHHGPLINFGAPTFQIRKFIL